MRVKSRVRCSALSDGVMPTASGNAETNVKKAGYTEQT